MVSYDKWRAQMPRMADPISIKFEKPTVQDLKLRAKKEDKTVSQLIRELVILALEKSQWSTK
jgi:hypothetical protein